MRWDSHIHYYGAEVLEDPAGWGERMGERHWVDLVTRGPQGWVTEEAMLRDMDAVGVEVAYVLGWYWERPEAARRQNEWMADLVRRRGDRFRAAVSLHPGMGDPVVELEASRQWGAVGVGELLPAVQSTRGWEDPFWEAMLTWTAGAGWPVTLHVTEAAGHWYPGRIETPLMELVALFERHPGQKWICAHWGGGLPFYGLNRRVAQALRNVWVDTAASPLLYNAAVWARVRDLLGAEKILAGSDYPLKLRPRLGPQRGWEVLWEQLATAGFSEAERAAVAGGNLRRLLGEAGEADAC